MHFMYTITKSGRVQAKSTLIYKRTSKGREMCEKGGKLGKKTVNSPRQANESGNNGGKVATKRILQVVC